MKRFLPIWLLLLIGISINVFFRMNPAFLFFTKSFAKEDVTTNLVKQARKQIDENFKELPQRTRPKATQQLVRMWKKERKKSINEAILDKQKELKSKWQDDTGQTFLLEIDPYHWLRLVDNLIKYGQVGDSTIDGVQYDSFMLAPSGMKVEKSLHSNLHAYIAYYLFKFARIFNRDLPLMHFVFYIPVFISAIGLILLFLLCLSINTTGGGIAGFFAVISLGLSRVFLSRSVAGWFDTDPYIILFSVLSVWMYYLSLDFASGARRRALFAILGGLSIGLFSFTWNGWWYIFDLMLVSTLIYILNLYLLRRESPQEAIRLDVPLISSAVFTLSSFLFVGAFTGLAAVKQFISGPISIAFAKGYLQNQFWPNTFLTVDELLGEGLRLILERGGGPIVVLCGLCYLIVALFDKKSEDYRHRQFLIFYLAIWMVIMAYVSMKARRFSLLLVIPASISFGLVAEWAVNHLDGLIRQLIKRPRINIKAVIFVIFFVISLPFFTKQAVLTSRSAPAANRNWWNALEKIRTQTPENSIINSWWDFGHWFKAIAKRPVIFDGATQNTPMAYWMARCFLTDNEKEARGILRMLNSGSNKAFEELENLGIDRYGCLDILNEIILLEEDDADKVLAKFISRQEDREIILQYTHHPRSAYFIVEPTLVEKMRSLSFMANWDFVKADIYREFKQLKQGKFIEYLIKEHKYNEADAQELNDNLVFITGDDALHWISAPYRYIGQYAFSQKAGSFVFFRDGFVVDLESHDAYVSGAQDGVWRIPKSLFYLEEGVIKEKKFKNDTVDLSLLLIPDGDSYRLLALDGMLARSMLTRMYYLPELRLKYFKPIITEELIGENGHIIVYHIDWDGNG